MSVPPGIEYMILTSGLWASLKGCLKTGISGDVGFSKRHDRPWKGPFMPPTLLQWLFSKLSWCPIPVPPHPSSYTPPNPLISLSSLSLLATASSFYSCFSSRICLSSSAHHFDLPTLQCISFGTLSFIFHSLSHKTLQTDSSSLLCPGESTWVSIHRYQSLAMHILLQEPVLPHPFS